MERSEWLKKIRHQMEELYDHVAPAYWDNFGLYDNTVHRQFVNKLLGQLQPGSNILDAACGAGRYDGMLLDAGHKVLGIDQSAGMLEKARQQFPSERYPNLQYDHLALQDMDFNVEFDGAICIDAMEHIFPEDWPGILTRFVKALKPGGVFYFTVEYEDPGVVRQAYENALAQGLPVLFGELADKIDAAHHQVMALNWHDIPKALSGEAAYHFYPPADQLLMWLKQVGLVIEEQGTGHWYNHYLVQKKVS